MRLKLPTGEVAFETRLRRVGNVAYAHIPKRLWPTFTGLHHHEANLTIEIGA